MHNCHRRHLIWRGALLGGVAAVLALRQPDDPLSLGLAAWILGSLAWVLILRSRNRFPGLVQVRLSARGCRQFDDLSGPSFLKDAHFVWRWIGLGLLLITFFGPDFIGLPERRRIDVINPILLCLSLFILGETGTVPTRRTAESPEWTPWPAVALVIIEPRANELCHIELQLPTRIEHCSGDSEGSGTRTVTPCPVDAEVICSKEQAEALRDRIHGWRSRAP